MSQTNFSGPVNSTGGFQVNNTPTSPSGTLPKSGSYYSAVAINLTTATISGGTCHLSGLYLSRATRFDRISLEVTTAGLDVGTVTRLGIYADDGFVEPGLLVLDAGTVLTGSGSGTGTREITINQTLVPGLWWLAAVSQAVTSTGPAYRVISVGGVPALGYTSPAASPACGYQMTGVTGALPALASGFTLFSAPIRVFLRAA